MISSFRDAPKAQARNPYSRVGGYGFSGAQLRTIARRFAAPGMTAFVVVRTFV
jgi:hypothetical protein